MFLKEECIKILGMEKNDSPTVILVGQLANIILGRVFAPKYLDPGSPVVNLHQPYSNLEQFYRHSGIHKFHDQIHNS